MGGGNEDANLVTRSRILVTGRRRRQVSSHRKTLLSVKRVLFCKLGLLHKGFWGLYFGGTLSAVWASGGNFLPDFIFGSWRYHVRRPHPLFTGHGFVPWTSFDRIVRKYGGDVRVRTLRCTEHFRVMAFAQVTYRESLRDIEACLGAQPSKLCSMGCVNLSRSRRWPMPTSYVIGAYGSIWPLSSSNERVNFM